MEKVWDAHTSKFNTSTLAQVNARRLTVFIENAIQNIILSEFNPDAETPNGPGTFNAEAIKEGITSFLGKVKDVKAIIDNKITFKQMLAWEIKQGRANEIHYTFQDGSTEVQTTKRWMSIRQLKQKAKEDKHKLLGNIYFIPVQAVESIQIKVNVRSRHEEKNWSKLGIQK
jgi:hypothetical protein